MVPERLQKRLDMANRQVERDLEIWAHQIYLDPPALASLESKGYRSLRNWSKRFYPLIHAEESANAQDQAKQELTEGAPHARMASVLISA